MNCCSKCFGDRGLSREIIPTLPSSLGTCSYCGTENESLVEPAALRDCFELVVNIYRRDNEGKSLVEWFKDDWAMFDHPRMDIAHAKELLADILDDGDIVRQKFLPSDSCLTDRLDWWRKLRSELMYENRFFPKTKLNEDRLGDLLDHLLLDRDELPDKWYRARIQETDTAYSANEMGAPPKRRAAHGRANPAGIPYLYIASNPNTAISEIRPHTGEIACVADFLVPKELDLKVVDLRHPRKTASPFILADENDVALLRGDIEFLEHLGEELTRPVLPQAAAIDYVPSQYLCEFIKNRGFHGVMYRSSVGTGVNFALFYPELAAAGVVVQRRVSRVSVELDGG